MPKIYLIEKYNITHNNAKKFRNFSFGGNMWNWVNKAQQGVRWEDQKSGIKDLLQLICGFELQNIHLLKKFTVSHSKIQISQFVSRNYDQILVHNLQYLLNDALIMTVGLTTSICLCSGRLKKQHNLKPRNSHWSALFQTTVLWIYFVPMIQTSFLKLYKIIVCGRLCH